MWPRPVMRAWPHCGITVVVCAEFPADTDLPCFGRGAPAVRCPLSLGVACAATMLIEDRYTHAVTKSSGGETPCPLSHIDNHARRRLGAHIGTRRLPHANPIRR